jgi:hypothetical protein
MVRCRTNLSWSHQESQSDQLTYGAVILLMSLQFVSGKCTCHSQVSASALVFGCGSDYVLAMRQADFSQRNTTPRRFTALVKSRFLPGRERLYRERIDGEPTDRQVALIQTLARLEWSALKAEWYASRTEGVASLSSDRESREHRRLYDRLLDEFETTLAPPPKKRRGPSLHDIVTETIAARGSTS